MSFTPIEQYLCRTRAHSTLYVKKTVALSLAVRQAARGKSGNTSNHLTRDELASFALTMVGYIHSITDASNWEDHNKIFGEIMKIKFTRKTETVIFFEELSKTDLDFKYFSGDTADANWCDGVSPDCRKFYTILEGSIGYNRAPWYTYGGQNYWTKQACQLYMEKAPYTIGQMEHIFVRNPARVSNIYVAIHQGGNRFDQKDRNGEWRTRFDLHNTDDVIMAAKMGLSWDEVDSTGERQFVYCWPQLSQGYSTRSRAFFQKHVYVPEMKGTPDDEGETATIVINQTKDRKKTKVEFDVSINTLISESKFFHAALATDAFMEGNEKRVDLTAHKWATEDVLTALVVYMEDGCFCVKTGALALKLLGVAAYLELNNENNFDDHLAKFILTRSEKFQIKARAHALTVYHESHRMLKIHLSNDINESD